MPLANTLRPTDFSDMIGQKHIIGPNGILTRMLKQGQLMSFIFYGPPGCGKTTTARILASKTNKDFIELNAVTTSIKDIRSLIDEHDTTFILYLDEIQFFNRKQQQSLLPFVESGQIILIAATTENPYYCCYDALLSRATPLEFKPIPHTEIAQYLTTICQKENLDLKPDAANYIAQNSAGDIRRALNMIEIVTTQNKNTSITVPDIQAVLPSVNMSSFDTDSDDHYALISGLQKSIRGSDPNAAVFYLARLLEGGDILSPCRRLLVIANEDIGLANPSVIPITYAATESAKVLGMPEAAKPLTNAVILLATSPKSNSSCNAYGAAADDIHSGLGGTVPFHLRHEHQPGYIYPHNYPNHWVEQQYLPDDLINRAYYKADNNATEQQAKNYWNYIKQKNEW